MQFIHFFNFTFSFKCKRCVNNIQVKLPPENSDCTSDLSQWFHCCNNKGIPDDILSKSWDITKTVSFVFHHRSATVATVEPVVEVKKTKVKKIIEEDDIDEDYEPEDDGKDEDFEL